VSYLAAAERAGDWLVATARRDPDGWCWPVRPGVSAEVESGVGWGTAGPAMFFVEAFGTTGDERWLAAARQGHRWMAAHLGECAEAWAGCGLFTGIGGWAVVLDELADTADDEASRQLAGRVLEEVAARASAGGGPGGGTVHWHDLTIASRVVCTQGSPSLHPRGGVRLSRRLVPVRYAQTRARVGRGDDHTPSPGCIGWSSVRPRVCPIRT
jgi:hypothetical protein